MTTFELQPISPMDVPDLDEPMDLPGDAEHRFGQAEDVDLDLDLLEDREQEEEDANMSDDADLDLPRTLQQQDRVETTHDDEMADANEREELLADTGSIYDEDLQDAELADAEGANDINNAVDGFSAPQVSIPYGEQNQTSQIHTAPLLETQDAAVAQENIPEDSDEHTAALDNIKSHQSEIPNESSKNDDHSLQVTLSESATQQSINQNVEIEDDATALIGSQNEHSNESSDYQASRAQMGEDQEIVAPVANTDTHVPESNFEKVAEPLLDAEHLHPVVVNYMGVEMSLFPPIHEEQEHAETYFLDDEGIATQSMKGLLEECRSVLAETISEHDELTMTVDELGLQINESAEEASQISLTQLIDMYVQLQRQDGVHNPPPFYVNMYTVMKFSHRLQHLRTIVSEGKGLSSVRAAEFMRAAESQKTQDASEPVGDSTSAGHIHDQETHFQGNERHFEPENPLNVASNQDGLDTSHSEHHELESLTLQPPDPSHGKPTDSEGHESDKVGRLSKNDERLVEPYANSEWSTRNDNEVKDGHAEDGEGEGATQEENEVQVGMQNQTRSEKDEYAHDPDNQSFEAEEEEFDDEDQLEYEDEEDPQAQEESAGSSTMQGDLEALAEESDSLEQPAQLNVEAKDSIIAETEGTIIEGKNRPRLPAEGPIEDNIEEDPNSGEDFFQGDSTSGILHESTIGLTHSEETKNSSDNIDLGMASSVISNEASHVDEKLDIEANAKEQTMETGLLTKEGRNREESQHGGLERQPSQVPETESSPVNDEVGEKGADSAGNQDEGFSDQEEYSAYETTGDQVNAAAEELVERALTPNVEQHSLSGLVPADGDELDEITYEDDEDGHPESDVAPYDSSSVGNLKRGRDYSNLEEPTTSDVQDTKRVRST